MGEIYQRSVADGSPSWSPGADNFAACWAVAADRLRFHHGKGYTITDRGENPPRHGPMRPLGGIPTVLEPQMRHAKPDTVFVVEALADGFKMALRRHLVVSSKADIILANATEAIGTPYVFGGTDCSWLTLHCYAKVGITLPHNAHAQHLDPQVVEITRSQIKPGDLLFHHNDEHVSLYLDAKDFGRVIDEEPHSTTAPPGWPTSTTGTGCRIRPMNPNYYTDWAGVCGIGRVVSVNGKP